MHIRKAIALATDYDTIHNTIIPGGELTGPLPKTFAGAYLPTPAPNFDLEAAKAEIAKSGYAGKTDIPLSLTYVSSAKFEEELALLMQSNLQQIGFKVTLSGEPWNRVTEIATKVETTPNVTEVFFGPTYPSPDSMFYAQYDSNSAGTMGVDGMVAKSCLRSTTNDRRWLAPDAAVERPATPRRRRRFTRISNRP